MQPEPVPATDTLRPKSRVGTAVGLAGLAAAVLAKGKLALGLVKALPFGTLLITSRSVLLSVAAYAAGNGWAFAFGFVILILLHELGHGAAMRASGIRSGWPIFIPFFGAMIAMKDQPADPRQEAFIAYAGPL